MATAKKKTKEQPPGPPPVKNRVRHYRKKVLAISKVELAGYCRMSDRTIYRVEQEVERFKAETYYAILNGINKALKERSDAEITFEDLFPGLEKP